MTNCHSPSVDTEMVWLLTSVIGGEAMETKAHVLDDGGGGFRQIGLQITGKAPAG